MMAEECVEELLKLVISKCDEIPVELEVRFKKVSKSFFNKCLALVKRFNVVQVCESVTDVFYSYRNQLIRTRLLYDTQTLSIIPTHICKRRIAQCEFGAADSHFKISVAAEIPPNDIPVTITTTKYCRLKTVYRFDYTPRRETHAVWRYEFSIVHAGKTVSQAEHQRQEGKTPTYEIEIELLDVSYVLRAGIKYTAQSILCKIQDFVGNISHPRFYSFEDEETTAETSQVPSDEALEESSHKVEP